VNFLPTHEEFPVRRRIGIVGGGYTGSVLAANLLREDIGGADIVLIERSMAIGPGLAYSTQNPNHLLNVRASNMSAFADDPAHFLRWLKARGAATTDDEDWALSNVFVPRRDYGLYIEDVFRESVSGRGVAGDVIVLQKSAVEIRAGTPLVVGFDDGTAGEFDHVVLCIGNFPPSPPAALGPVIVDSVRFIGNPWDEARLAAIPTADSVLIIGCGLTMADVVGSLCRQGHEGLIEAISRHGLATQRHLPVAPYSPFLSAGDLPLSLPSLLRRVRTEVRRAAALGYDWRSVIDSLRPLTTPIWLSLSLDERRRFLRHLRPYWDIHRHRLAPANADALAALQQEGRLRLHAGRIAVATQDGDGFAVTFRRYRSAETETIATRWIINCSGPLRDFGRINDPLVRSLFDRGDIRPDVLRLGLDITPDNRLLRRDGRAWDNLYTLGPTTLGAHWEIIAVPDLRNACATFAKVLAKRLN
jgi:uncharacterized NAD(P)/FAD-binding protein YdhS